MSMIVRGIEDAIKKGQASVAENIKILVEQNNTMIDNQNEMITLMLKICKKFKISAKTENKLEDVKDAN
jgi:hypothetical protein